MPIYTDGYSDDLDAVDRNGSVPVPKAPGLGVAINWDWLARNVTGTVIYE
jgi:hypothetical protein